MFKYFSEIYLKHFIAGMRRLHSITSLIKVSQDRNPFQSLETSGVYGKWYIIFFSNLSSRHKIDSLIDSNYM